MRFFRNILAVVVALGLAGAGQRLLAQPADQGTEPAEVTAPMEREAQISPAEMQQRASELIAEMREMLKRAVKLQRVARRDNDVIKLNCVNDKLLQLKQLLNIAESSRTNLIEAITAADEADRYHQFSQITIAHERSAGLRDEAEACIGDELIFLGPTEVDVEGPDVTDDPTDDDPFDFDGPDFERPSYASPFS